MPADPHILPFAPAGGGDDRDEHGDGDELELGFGETEDLETAYRKALAAVDAVPPPPAPAAPAKGETTDGGDPAGPAGETAEPAPARVSPREVIEAALFVGGAGLTAPRASKLLRGTFSDADLAAAVGELNRRYDAGGRPYRIVAGADGWELKLRAQFEPIRRKLYGLGPREVSLPPGALEVLSVAAYGQPMTRAAIETARGGGDAGPALRRLVRLDLLRLTKPPAPDAGGDGEEPVAAGDPVYETTDRFLDLFGLGSLGDLPRPEDLNFK